VHKYYANSDIFVLPSFYEELGYIVLEAMAHGLPLIVSDIPTFRDFVHNGVNGFLVDPFDSEILASKLELLITDNRLRKRMAQKSIEIAKTNFSPQIIADMLVRSYEEIING
jgi:glycosyltransferase involved in cell wall biosynthesis